ncbi:MAG: EAL domain-containing protein [Massilia sp.]
MSDRPVPDLTASDHPASDLATSDHSTSDGSTSDGSSSGRPTSDRYIVSSLPRHETAELYRLMVEGIHEAAVFLMDPNGIITVWNKGAEDMKGYTAEEAIGSFLGLLYTEEDRERKHPEHNLAMAAEHGFFSEETWRRCKDGSRFWAHILLTALRGDNNELLGFSKVTVDLTRHKLLEQCQNEKAEIDLIMKAAESGTWKWDVEGDQVWVSPHLLQLLGHEGGERVLSFSAWLGFVHPEERAAFAAHLGRVPAHPQSAPIELETRLLHRDGDAQWFFMRANWHNDDARLDKQPVFMGACVAIDNLKKAEAERIRLLDSLRRERARFSNILEQMPSGVVLAEAPSGQLTYINRAGAEMLGRGIDDILSTADYRDFSTEDAEGRPVPLERLPLARVLGGETSPLIDELGYRRPDGALTHFTITAAAIDDGGDRPVAVAVMHDVTSLKRAQLQAATEKERAQVTLAAITDGVVTVDGDGTVHTMNPAAERLAGTSLADARGRRFDAVLHFEDAASAARIGQAIARCVAERRVITNLPYATLVGGGQRYAVENAVAPIVLPTGELIGVVLVFHDVTESKRLLRRLGFEASHDALTGLINRREFEARLQRAIERARHADADSSALLYMDLDQFKVVNDTCGHPAGDDLLGQLARLYAEHVRERDTLARIGGDEFAMIIEHCGVEEALAVANKILDTTRGFRYSCKGRVFQLGVSIGVSPVDQTTASVEDAMRRADHACYIAKERGRNRVYVHYKDDSDVARRRSDMHWVTRLSHAFQHEQLQLYCQPIVALSDDTPQLHYEILLRLKDGRGAPIAPGSFMAAAERYDVILKIDRSVLTRTLDWLAANPEHMHGLEMCSINLSRRSLADPSFHKFAADLIDNSPVPASKLCFEITEHGAIADMQKTIAFIEALSARGCRFSLDDFGTGMTSFSYLKQLPVDFIKIDGSFIQSMSSSQVDYEMVRFTNDISHMMGRKTIAEYVSDPDILDKLRRIGVDFAQGYWVGKPRPLAA